MLRSNVSSIISSRRSRFEKITITDSRVCGSLLPYFGYREHKKLPGCANSRQASTRKKEKRRIERQQIMLSLRGLLFLGKRVWSRPTHRAPPRLRAPSVPAVWFVTTLRRRPHLSL